MNSMVTVTDGVDALTSDGGIVTIRRICGTDRRGITRLYGRASPDSLRLRFFGRPTSGTLAAEIDRLCQPESDRHLAVLTLEAGTVVGVASCERTDDVDRRARSHPARAAPAGPSMKGNTTAGSATVLPAGASAPAADDDDRAVCVLHAVLTHRTEHHPGESTVSAAPDNEQPRLARQIE
jgi:hypothetical protein